MPRLSSPLLLLACVAATPGHATSPSFDCARADSAATELVCRDGELAALDLEVGRLFALAKGGPHMTAERRKELVATQRGWIKGRDDCWKSDDLRRCVRDNYLLRIHELRQGYADARSQDASGISKGPLVADCAGLGALVGITFIASEPPHAYLEWLDRFLVMTLAPSGSGSRYAVRIEEGDEKGDYVFWVKGDEARFEQPGREALECRIAEPG